MSDTHKSHIVVFTSDVHGNSAQYKKLVDYALEINARSVVIGGDLSPKGSSLDDTIREMLRNPNAVNFIEVQRRFLGDTLPRLLRPLKESNIPAFLIMGNDDFRINTSVIDELDEFQAIHGKRHPLTSEIDIVGYSCVNLTPFLLKDWELHDVNGRQQKPNQEGKEEQWAHYAHKGAYSTLRGVEQHLVHPFVESPESIEHDLQGDIFCQTPQKTVYVMHCPPYGTALDRLDDGTSVGSRAIRSFIEQRQPKVTLHGHIHETVEVSGTFKERIGKTYCFAAGNDYTSKKLAVIVFDAYRPERAQRVLL